MPSAKHGTESSGATGYVLQRLPEQFRQILETTGQHPVGCYDGGSGTRPTVTTEGTQDDETRRDGAARAASIGQK